MEIRFLLGPAGSGKTHACLAEARRELKTSQEGLPLLFLAPKQSTYQIERELLSDPDLPGFTRLQVAGFEAVANFILNEAPTRRRLLDEHGRVMVLRALLSEHHSQLRVYHANARLPGFAQELSATLRELQQARLTPEQVRLAATRDRVNVELCDKLLDLAHLLEAYQKWLAANYLHDPYELLALAAAALAESDKSFRLGALWLDGFAELTAQELHFLSALVQASDRATLAFCVDPRVRADPGWHSIWNIPARTVDRCRQGLESLPGAGITIHRLDRDSERTRFRPAALQRLEANWSDAMAGGTPALPTHDAVHIFKCGNPAIEAATCAREILKFVQSGQGRFRDVAVLTRSLQTHDAVLCRTFKHYDIPFFIDRREPVAHHPLAELIRYALNLPAKGWQQEDWFGVMKTGLVVANDSELDRLENEARARGWQGDGWFRPLAGGFEAVRQKLVPPFERFGELCGATPTGVEMAAGLRKLFVDLAVAERLQEWSETAANVPAPHGSAGASPYRERAGICRSEIHEAVWRTIDELFGNIELAFGTKALLLDEWIDVIEAALMNLNVGVIPPALDQVLIGAVDRSRNPDLRMAIVVGLNEGVFPAALPDPGLLSEYDRKVLIECEMPVDAKSREQLGREQYLAYIACTRARDRLVLTFAERDGIDKALNPSSILEHVRSLIPTKEFVAVVPSWSQSIHWRELLPALLDNPLDGLASMPIFKDALEQWRWSVEARSVGPLSQDVVERLYGKQLSVSISKLEDYAACSFKFFLAAGLRVAERKKFEVDKRLSGQFQHRVLQRFQEQIQAEGKRWRDLTQECAAEMIARIGREVQQEFEGGIFLSSPRAQFEAQALIARLQRLARVLVGWAPHYEFEPSAAELSFGNDGDAFAAWEIELANGLRMRLRGRIDRVDVDRTGGSVVAIDYKTSGQKVEDILLKNGIDLQLLGYLAALRHLPEVASRLGVSNLQPAGGFYVNLRGERQTAKDRAAALDEPAMYQHHGRFRFDLITRFDSSGAQTGAQFSFGVTNNGGCNRTYKEPLSGAEFEALVDQTEVLIRQFGDEIFDGIIEPDPYRQGQKTPCEWCDYGRICRFDPWTQSYRSLRKVEAGAVAGNDE